MSTLARIQRLRAAVSVATISTLLVLAAAPIQAQRGAAGNESAPPDTLNDPVRLMVARLDLEKYKATIKGLTQFGDRRQGTERNRKAVDWIEAQLKSYGCTPTERITYTYVTPPPRGRGGAGGDSAGGRGRGRGNAAQGGGRIRGYRIQTGVNTDSLKQPDPRIRALDTEPAKDGERQEVFCTKVGSTHPEEMYIVGGHMDGHGWNEAANDDGSGTALVMELARVFTNPDVKTERSIRFALWNGEETGLNGARAYVAQRQALQGIENPKGSGKYPEPKWLGMIQHDMMMWDHGMPQAVLGPDGKQQVDANGRGVFAAPKEQRPEADVNVEFQIASKMADESMKLAFVFKLAGEKYATDYPVNVGPHMTNTDSDPFMNIVPSLSLRENERGAQTGAGWNPTWHQPIDLYSTFSDKDFRLGLNAAQTTLSAIAQLTGAKINK